MNAQEHYEEAERWLQVSNQKANEAYEPQLLARAQAHATLALAASHGANEPPPRVMYHVDSGMSVEAKRQMLAEIERVDAMGSPR